MARINIEECWWSDPRRTKLIKLVGVAADGYMVNAWRIAQEFWARGELIPLHVWDTVEANANLIEASLAEIRQDGVYVRGSSQYLDWVAERRRAAKAGGKKSAQKRSKKPKKLQANVNQNQANVNQAQPSGSGSSSGSSSDSGSEALPILSESAPGNLVKTYCDFWRQRNGRSPSVTPKDAGQLTKLAKDIGYEAAVRLVETFFSMPDPFYIKRGYDVATLITQRAAIEQFQANGKIITAAVVKQVEKQVDKIQGTKRGRSIAELEAEREAMMAEASGQSGLKITGGTEWE